MFRKNKLAMLVGEFLGTFLLTMVVLGALRSQAGGFFVAVAAGTALVLLTIALGGISGAVVNPAITIALWSVRKLRALQALFYILVQFAGAAAAWYLFVYITKLDVSMVQHEKVTELAARPLVSEALGTFVFAFAIAAATYQRLRLGVKASTIGVGLTLGALVASLASAAFLNPAVAFAIQQWNIFTYMIAPVLGAVLGMNLYNLLFVGTEIAEAEELREESKVSKLDSSVSHSLVAQEYTAKKKVASDKVKVSGAAARKTAAKKVAKKKTAAKK